MTGCRWRDHAMLELFYFIRVCACSDWPAWDIHSLDMGPKAKSAYSGKGKPKTRLVPVWPPWPAKLWRAGSPFVPWPQLDNPAAFCGQNRAGASSRAIQLRVQAWGVQHIWPEPASALWLRALLCPAIMLEIFRRPACGAGACSGMRISVRHKIMHNLIFQHLAQVSCIRAHPRAKRKNRDLNDFAC